VSGDSEHEVVVVGGGPAGASVAGLLALAGHDVAIVEREKFPRYHIGESLITGFWPTIEQLGLTEKLESMGFQPKLGASLLWGRDQGEPWTFKFRDASQYDHSFQVYRQDFDAMLLDRARELGVVVIEEASVKEPLFDGDRMTGLTYQRRGGEPARLHSQIVIDASGQQRWLGRHFGLVEWHEDLRNLAVWSYFEGCGRFEGEDSGNILTENRPHGWLWFIPLAGGLTSIGYVTPSALLAADGRAPEEILNAEIGTAPVTSGLTSQARRVSDYRTARDWSYTCRKFHGPGWVTVGDAAAFVDPLLSTGVTLAMRGARKLAPAVHEALTAPDQGAQALADYETGYRNFLHGILEFVRFFYDQTRQRSDYDHHAQALIDPGAQFPARIDFITLVSGLEPSERGNQGQEIIEQRMAVLRKMREEQEEAARQGV
jgi:flavin-dependent dehydrogenase